MIGNAARRALPALVSLFALAPLASQAQAQNQPEASAPPQSPSQAQPEAAAQSKVTPLRITTVTGRVFSGIDILEQDDRGITFRHSNGVGRVLFREMDLASRKDFVATSTRTRNPAAATPPQRASRAPAQAPASQAVPSIVVVPVQIQISTFPTPRVPSSNTLRYWRPRLKPWSVHDIARLNDYYYRRGWGHPFTVSPSPCQVGFRHFPGSFLSGTY